MCDQIARIAIISTCQKMIEWVKLVETDRLIMKQFFSFQKSTDIKHELFMVLSLGAGVRLRREKERETERRKESERVCYSSPGGTVSPPLQHEQPAPCGPQTHTHTHTPAAEGGGDRHSFGASYHDTKDIFHQESTRPPAHLRIQSTGVRSRLPTETSCAQVALMSGKVTVVI